MHAAKRTTQRIHLETATAHKGRKTEKNKGARSKGSNKEEDERYKK